jgi:uncharacterized protein (TIGR00730 family)
MDPDHVSNGVPARAPTPVKAYNNLKFFNSRDARVLRILAEYLEPQQRFRRYGVQDTIVMFGSARARPMDQLKKEFDAARQERKSIKGRVPPELYKRLERLHWDLELARYYEEACELSRMLTEWGQSRGPGRRFVLCSGGGPGIMEAANRGATERAGGISVGLSISIPTEELPNPYISPELAFNFHYFFMRKFWFVYMAAALIIFPGGFGTLDELFEVLTLLYTRKVTRPLPVVIYGRKYWDEVIDFQAMARWGTISKEALGLFKYCDTPKEAFTYLKATLAKLFPEPVEKKAP